MYKPCKSWEVPTSTGARRISAINSIEIYQDQRKQFLYDMFFHFQAFWAGSIWYIWMANFFDSSLVLIGIPKEEFLVKLARDLTRVFTPNGGEK